MADNVEIQGLEFQIQEDSAEAVKGLDALTSTLERLKTATGGGVSGLRTTAKQLTALNTALSWLMKVVRLAFPSSDRGRSPDTNVVILSPSVHLILFRAALRELSWLATELEIFT